MSTTMAISVEQIHNINLTMRMISFNSKIEAVRAGEAGKAFAVVSGEMKSLSDKTTVVTDNKGLVLADSANKILAETLHFPEMEKLYKLDQGFIIQEINGRHYCIAHARAPDYETYQLDGIR